MYYIAIPSYKRVKQLKDKTITLLEKYKIKMLKMLKIVKIGF